MNWVRTDYGWRHRPWWKVAINFVLRRLQPWTMEKWVVFTICESVDDDSDRAPVTLGYGFGPVQHLED
jgi:hypothetical protein